MVDPIVEIWAVVDPGLVGHESISGLPGTGIVSTHTSEQDARDLACYRDEGLNRTRPDRKFLVVRYTTTHTSDPSSEIRPNGEMLCNSPEETARFVRPAGSDETTRLPDDGTLIP